MSAPEYQITSPHNPRVGQWRALQTAKGRIAAGALLIEGPHVIQEALHAHLRPLAVWYDPQSPSVVPLREDLADLADEGIEVVTASPSVIDRIAETRTPQGIIATLALADITPDRLRSQRRGRARPILLILDAISDPGNVGTILRSALAADVDEVLLTPHCADPYGPKVIRAGSGAHFHLPLRPNQDWEAIAARVAGSPQVHTVALADSNAADDYTALDLTSRTALIVSNEAHGPSAPARHLTTHPVRIPMYNGVESLNAAIAASIILFESVRQRHAGAATE